MGILYVFEQYVCFVFCSETRSVEECGCCGNETYCCFVRRESVFLGHGFVGGLWGEVDVLWTYCRVDLIDFKAPSSLF